jgi:hypothetical protein
MAKSRQTEPPLPMLQALQALNADGTMKGLAFNFLRTDFTKLTTEHDFRKAYAGLAACEQLLSPLDKRYAQALSGIRKTLGRLDQFVDGLQPDNSTLEELTDSYDAYLEELTDYWEHVLKLVKPHVPDHVYRELHKAGEGIFERSY